MIKLKTIILKNLPNNPFKYSLEAFNLKSDSNYLLCGNSHES